jgi:hypothetical protein
MLLSGKSQIPSAESKGAESSNGALKDEDEDVVYDSFDSLIMQQNAALETRRFPTFDAALDEFYAKVFTWSTTWFQMVKKASAAGSEGQRTGPRPSAGVAWVDVMPPLGGSFRAASVSASELGSVFLYDLAAVKGWAHRHSNPSNSAATVQQSQTHPSKGLNPEATFLCMRLVRKWKTSVCPTRYQDDSPVGHELSRIT